MKLVNPLKKIVEAFQNQTEQKEALAIHSLKARYHAFRIFLENNGIALEQIAQIDTQLIRGETALVRRLAEELISTTAELVDGLNLLSNDAHSSLYRFQGQLAEKILVQLDALKDTRREGYCIPLDTLRRDAAGIAGKKAANLARLRRLALPVPDGFVCTTAGTNRFLSMETLAADIRRLLRDMERGQSDLNLAADRITRKILDAPLPDDLAQDLENNYRLLKERMVLKREEPSPLAISVRSSGVSEDGVERSFAGQYTSILNVIGSQSLLVAYKEVIASGFSARAISYRLNAGLPPLDVDLAVLCQAMADVDCAGVLFTVDPSEPENGRMLISCVPGLGTQAVGGSSPADLYRPQRSVLPHEPETPYAGNEERHDINTIEAEIMDLAEIGEKTVREVAKKEGGVQLEQLSADEAGQPLLEVATIYKLMQYGQLLENIWGMAQDIEWAFSRTSGLSLLQARPLRLASKGRRNPSHDTAKRLLSGTCASSGKVIGCVRIALSLADLVALDNDKNNALGQQPTILVLSQSIVDASHLFAQCSGAVIDIGNPTDHLSCVARELGIPMITGTRHASTTLVDNQWIILDADDGTVREAPESVREAATDAFNKRKERTKGKSTDLLTNLRAETISPEREALRKLIIPLNLTDAYGSTFSLLECRSLHDIIRYSHEMAVMAMFDTGDMVMDFAGSLLHPLQIGVPFSFLVIDLGGGLCRTKESFLRKQLALPKHLGREDVLSIPLAALCDGLMTPGLSWHSTPDGAAMGSIMSQTMLSGRGRRPIGSCNYALAARDYLNLNARVEFHFAMLDAICGRDTHVNYIRFRFKGGGTGRERGHRRALFLQHVLEKNGFYTTVIGDLITATLTGASKEIVHERLIMIGRLLGFSRFLDGIMSEDTTPIRLAEEFLAGNFSTRESGDPSGVKKTELG
ncbi:MAG: PEP/pyruvate-binding domain-containing protein [Pseudomonadota bacterium]